MRRFAGDSRLSAGHSQRYDFAVCWPMFMKGPLPGAHASSFILGSELKRCLKSSFMVF